MAFTIVDGLLALLDLFVDALQRLRGKHPQRRKPRDREPPEPPAT